MKTVRIGRTYEGQPLDPVAGWDTYEIEDGKVRHVSFEPNPEYVHHDWVDVADELDNIGPYLVDRA